MASDCRSMNIVTHFVLASSGCAIPCVSTFCCSISGTLLWGVGSHYLLFLIEDCNTMLESAAACGVRLAPVLGDVVESSNTILRRGTMGIVLGVGMRLGVQRNGKQWESTLFGNGGL